MGIFQPRFIVALFDTLVRQLENFAARRVTGFQVFSDHIRQMHQIRSVSRAREAAHLSNRQSDDSCSELSPTDTDMNNEIHKTVNSRIIH